VNETLKSYLYLVLFLLLMYVVGRYVLEYVLPFAIGLALALMIDPLVTFLEERLRLPRGLASALALLGLLGVIVLVAFLGVARIIVELTSLSEGLPDLYTAWLDTARALLADLERLVASLPPGVNAVIEDWIRNLYINTGRYLNVFIMSARSFIFTGLPKFFVVLLLSMVATFFLSRDKRLVGQFLLQLAPPEWRPQLVATQAEVWKATIGLVNAQLFLVLLTALATVVGLSLIGVDFALTIGTIAGLLDIVPVVGPALIFVPWVLYLVFTGDWSTALWIGGLWGGVTALRAMAQAHVIGERIGLHPLATLLALYLGARVFGTNGLLIGPLVAILLKASIHSGLLPIFRHDQAS